MRSRRSRSAGIGDREDFYTTLHAVFVKKHEHSLLFDQAFRIFWKRKGFIEKLIAMLSPRAPSKSDPKPPEAGASRVADALFKSAHDHAKPPPAIELDARLTMSAAEILRSKDFAQMSAAEIEEARKAIKRLAMPEDKRQNAALCSGRPAGSDRCAPQFPPFAAARRRDRPRVSLADRSRPAGRRLVRHLRIDERIHPPLSAFSARLGRNAARFDFPVRHPPDQRDPRDARPRS